MIECEQSRYGKVGEQRNKNMGSAVFLKLTASSEEPENHKLEVNTRCLSQQKRSKEVKREEKGRRSLPEAHTTETSSRQT